MQLPVKLRRPAYRFAYNCLRIYWFVVRPAITGVKCVLTDGDRVLLVRHTYGPPKWELPGGGAKRHEPPQATARREIAEELGLEIDNWMALDTVTGNVHGRRDTIHCFHAEVTNPTLTLDHGEIKEVNWFDSQALPPKLGEYVEQILERLGAEGRA